MYLPIELNTPILAGALVAWLVRATARGDAALAKARNDRGTLVASGLIAGGALAGVLQGLTDLAAEWGWFTVPTFDADGALGNWIGLAVFLALGAGIWLDARRTRVEHG